ncbi:MAG: hypothetical protein AB2693_17630 [Candidatus Thiodiazotropha sp.]
MKNKRKTSNHLHPHLLQAQQALALLLSKIGRPDTESYPAPSHYPITPRIVNGGGNVVDKALYYQFRDRKVDPPFLQSFE